MTIYKQERFLGFNISDPKPLSPGAREFSIQLGEGMRGNYHEAVEVITDSSIVKGIVGYGHYEGPIEEAKELTGEEVDVSLTGEWGRSTSIFYRSDYHSN